jgi:hypothetical protein
MPEENQMQRNNRVFASASGSGQPPIERAEITVVMLKKKCRTRPLKQDEDGPCFPPRHDSRSLEFGFETPGNQQGGHQSDKLMVHGHAHGMVLVPAEVARSRAHA